MRVITGLLNSRTRCLEQLIEISAEFLGKAEKDDFSKLDVFEKSREATLKAFSLFGRKLAETVEASSRSEADLALIRAELERGDLLLQRLHEMDQRTMALLEKERDRVSAELNAMHSQGTQLKKFRSEAAPAGERLDQKL